MVRKYLKEVSVILKKYAIKKCAIKILKNNIFNPSNHYTDKNEVDLIA